MNRRDILQRSGATLVATATLGLAGCGGSQNGDDGNGEQTPADSTNDTDGSSETTTPTDDTEPTATETATCEEASGEPTGEVTENVVAGIEVTDYSAQRGSDSFTVSVTLENVGEETTTMEYNIDVTTYDGSGTALNEGFTTIQRSYTDDYAPGESQTFEVEPQLDCPSAVARYEIEVNCAATPNSGDYCN